MVSEREAAGTTAVEQHDEVVVLRLREEHDISTVSALRASIQEALQAGAGVVVSVAETRFIDLSITHAIYEGDAQLKERGRRLVLHVHTRSIVRRVLELSGLVEDLPCTDALDKAITQARSRDTDKPWWRP